MLDTCTITRAGTGDGTFDPETGETVPPARTSVYSGRCRVRQPNVGEQTPLVAGQEITLVSAVVAIPWSTTGVEVGDQVAITASADPGLVGRVLSARRVITGSFLSSRRLHCVDDQG